MRFRATKEWVEAELEKGLAFEWSDAEPTPGVSGATCWVDRASYEAAVRAAEEKKDGRSKRSQVR